ncbi:MAG: DNA topoisomerase [Spirochaetaceae bacterium]|jgi:DNA topoisomerase-3|nr:DNA topoisomerase [Spirochaetaceae bacterium]
MIILTEKPSVAAAFASALGVPRSKDGYWENGQYCIVNAVGHLLENYAPDDYDRKFKKWSLEDLPIIPREFKYKPVEKTKAQLALVTRCLKARKGDALLLATDAEREGELIGAEILQYAGFTGYASAKRFWVSEALTREVILSGIEKAKPLAEYESYQKEGYARQQADWLTGINLTRLISLKSGLPLSFGRVQTAVLAAVYEREDAVGRFVKEKFFEVTASLHSGQGPHCTVKLVNKENGEYPFRFPEGAAPLAEITSKRGELKTAAITGLSSEKKTEHPPKLFNITALQKEAHKAFSLSPEKTLETAQALYEKHKCLSYPRTPSRVMGDDNVSLVKGIYDNLAGVYPELASGSDPARIAPSNKRVFNSAELQDHHALIPLIPLPAGASEEEKAVFGLVVKRFFTVFKGPYVYNAVSIDAAIAGYLFRENGTDVLEAGWKAGNDADDDGDEEPENNYAGLSEGGEYPVVSVVTEEKYTQPKKHYTYATILALMENPRGEDGKHLAGLGTPATRAAILKKLIDKKYLVEKGKNLLITGEGKFLIETVRENPHLAAFVSVPETTRWEEALRASTASFLEGIKRFTAFAVTNTAVTEREKPSLGTCPRCGAAVREGKKSY